MVQTISRLGFQRFLYVYKDELKPLPGQPPVKRMFANIAYQFVEDRDLQDLQGHSDLAFITAMIDCGSIMSI